MSDNEFKYFAFISYSHADEKWGNWIYRSILRYRFPVAIRKRHGAAIPRRIDPLFLDCDKLKVGHVWGNIASELEQSKYLIVLCSPNSAKPNAAGEFWVNREVEYFAGLKGRVNRIIPVIIEGTPEQSFCPALKNLGDLQWQDAAKVRPRRRLLCNVVAGLLGLAPDELWRSESRRIRRRRIIVTCCSFALTVAIGVASLIVWDLCGVHKSYYGDYVNDYELPNGIFPLSAEEKASRNRHYEFSYRGYRQDCNGQKVRALRSVKLCNFAGTVSELPFKDVRFPDPRPIWQDFEYREDGRLREKVVKNDWGIELYRYSFPKDNVIEIIERQSIAASGSFSDFRNPSGTNVLNTAIGAEWLGSFMSGFRPVSNVRRLFLEDRDTNGIPSRIFFFANDGKTTPCVDERGACGEDLTFDRMGRVVRRVLIDANGDALIRTNTVASVDISYDERGGFNVSTKDSNGRICGNRFGWKQCQYDCDANLNITNCTFMDEEGKCTWGPNGYGSCSIEYYGQGGCISRFKFYDDDGKLSCHGRGYAIRENSKISREGRVEEVRYYNERAEPCVSADGSAVCRLQYQCGDQKRIVTASYYGVKGESVFAKVGDGPLLLAHRHVKHFERHRDGLEEYASIYGLNDEPIRHPFGFFTAKVRVDSDGMELEFHDKDGSIMNVQGLLVAALKCRYITKFGRNVGARLAAYNDKGKLVVDPRNGNDTAVYRFDDVGRICAIEYLLGGHLKNNSLGYAKTYFEYDEFGRMVKTWDVAEDGVTVVPNAHGAPVRRCQYHNNRISRIEFCTLDGDLVDGNEGHAVQLMEYDSYGNSVRELYLDRSGKRANWKTTGVAEVCHAYSFDGKELEFRYFDENGCPVADTRTGAFVTRTSYDYHRNTRAQAYYDKDGKTPMISPVMKYHMIRITSNEVGQPIHEEHFALDQKSLVDDASGVAERKMARDPLGRPIRYANTSRDGLLVSEAVYAPNMKFGLPCWCVNSSTHGLQVGDLIVAIDRKIYAGRISQFDLNTYTNRSSIVTVARIGPNRELVFEDFTLDLHDGENWGWDVVDEVWFNKVKKLYAEWLATPVLLRSASRNVSR